MGCWPHTIPCPLLVDKWCFPHAAYSSATMRQSIYFVIELYQRARWPLRKVYHCLVLLAEAEHSHTLCPSTQMSVCFAGCCVPFEGAVGVSDPLIHLSSCALAEYLHNSLAQLGTTSQGVQ